jgi:ABC-2 type transport system permease protein
MTLGFWLVVLALCIYFLAMFNSVELFGPLLLRKALSMLLLSFSGLLLFSNIITALSSYFLADDMQLLQSLPVSRRRIFYVRFFDTVLNSSWMILIFGLPVLLAYGVVHSGGPLYYLLALPGLLLYLLPPAALGVVIACLLVRGFSAQRLREVMALVSGLFLVSVLLLLRTLQPEQLVDPDSFGTLAEFIAVVQAPDISWLPSTWLSQLCMWSLGNPVESIGLYAGLLCVASPASVVVARWMVAPIYFEAWSNAQEAPRKSASRSQSLTSAIDGLTAPLAPTYRALLRKDLRLFFREPGQWTQGLLLLGLIAIYLYSVKSLPLDVLPMDTQLLENVIAFLNVGVAGAVLASISVRFQFTSISREGRAFWVLHSSPIGARRYLLSKFFMGLWPSLLLGEILVLSTNSMLGVDPFYAFVAAATIALLAVALSGMAVGMGAMYPNFNADSAAQMAAGPGAILFMVLALLLVAAVVGIEAVPVGLFLARQYQGIEPSGLLIAGLVTAFLCVLALCITAAWLPMRKGGIKLWGDLGNVGD